MSESMEKRCPLTGHPCDQDCAWKRGKECAVWVLAGEAFALTEAFMVVHRLIIRADGVQRPVLFRMYAQRILRWILCACGLSS